MALQLVGLTGPAEADPARVVDVTLSVAPGEVTALVGPSGAGKSTLLRLVAGLEQPAAGTVELNGRRLDRLPVARRGVGLVARERPLQPNLDVAGNVEQPLRWQRVPADERRRRVAAETGALGLGDVLRRRPGTLSAGQRQATALARETARLPAVLLLDEPMAHLDAAERARLRQELGAYVRGLGVPVLLATNDQTEAMALGDALAVLDQGRLHQTGAPQRVYDAPATAFVAGFLGDPGASLLPARVEVGRHTAQLRIGDGAWPVEPATGAVRRLDGARVLVAARPEDLSLAAPGQGVDATVAGVQRLGDRVRCHLRLLSGAETLVVLAAARDAPAPGATVGVVARAHRLCLFDAVTGRRAG